MKRFGTGPPWITAKANTPRAVRHPDSGAVRRSARCVAKDTEPLRLLRWNGLERAVKAGDAEKLTFEGGELVKRVAKVGDLFAPVLTLKQKLPAVFD